MPTGSRLRTQRNQQKGSTDHTPGKHGRAHGIKIEKGAIFGKGPDYLRGALDDPTELAKPGPKPQAGPLAVATLPEWYVWWALTNRLKKQPMVDFSYRGETGFSQGLSGRTQLDFEMLDGSNIALEIQGTFYHYEQGTAKIILDQVRAAELAAFWTVINIDEDDALRDPEYYVREALQGRDHSFRYTNQFVKPIGAS